VIPTFSSCPRKAGIQETTTPNAALDCRFVRE
jgi:hypothetical protein